MNLPIRLAGCVVALGALASIGGCSSVSAPLLDVVKGTFDRQRTDAASAVIPDAPNPAYRYLRVEVQGRPPALLVLGDLERSPMGEIEVWYSSRREVLKTLAGRIVGTSGLEIDWRSVRYPQAPPVWRVEPGLEDVYQRSRDVMPGYRFSVIERLALSQVIEAPSDALAQRLPKSVAWYLERIVSPTPAELPPSIYGLSGKQGQANVVYSRQCLSATFCLHLQPWPVATVVP